MNNFKRLLRENSVDRVALGELKLFMDNDRDLYRQKESILKNIERKLKSGKYDHSMAPKLWMYWVESGAKKYIKDFGTSSDTMKDMFPKNLRQELAQEFADENLEEIKIQMGID